MHFKLVAVMIMNNSLCFRALALILLGAGLRTSVAQELRPRAVEAGFCAGPTLGWTAAHTENYENKGIKVGGYYGLAADINLVRTKEFVFFSTGLVFKHIRFGLDYTDNYYLEKKKEHIDSARVSSVYNTLFFTIPTAIKLKTEPFSDFAIFGIAGLEHGFRLSAKSKDEVLRTDDTGEKGNKKQSENITPLKESLFAVLGVEYTLFKQTKATFGISYNYGLNSIFKGKYKNEITKERPIVNIHTIEFQFGFIF